ncbi:SPAG8 [Trypoxylus dichotomus]
MDTAPYTAGVNYETASDTSESCFKERYSGDSRKWIIRDASYRLPKGPLMSTMKAEYGMPLKEEQRTKIGKRRALLEQTLYDEINEKIVQENQVPPPIEEYCSTYDLTFQIPGFKPKMKTYGDQPELYEKYPLYSSSPMSYWRYQYDNRNGRRSELHSLTAIGDVKQPFKRSSAFSKPLAEVLDETDRL